jgi:HTH-type transcriptional regulator / antitoxin HigA
MDIRPIANDEDYEEALAEIRRLWSADATSPDAQKLEVLIFGTTARISEVLSGKRSLTLDMVRKLHFDLGVPLDSLVVQEKRTVRRPPPRSKRHRQHRAARP